MFKNATSSLWIFLFGLALIFAAIPKPVGGQVHIPHQKLGIEQGMPSNEVYCIVQDTNGIMWMGTDEGLVKYDGVKPKLIVPSDKPRISVLRLYLDPKERIWISTYRHGLFYVRNDSLIEPKFNSELLRGIAYNQRSYVRSFEIDQHDSLYFTLFSGGDFFFKTHVNSSTVQKINLEKGPRLSLFLVEITQGKTILGRSTSKEDYWKFKNSQDYQGDHLILDGNSQGNYVNYGYDSESRLYWLGKSIYHLDVKIDSIVVPSPINQIFKDTDNIFVSTNKGLYHYNHLGGRLKLKAIYFKDYFISRVLKDAEGVYWITTVGQGCLKLLSFKERKFLLPTNLDLIKNYSQVHLTQDAAYVLNNNEILRYSLLDPAHKETLFNFTHNDHSVNVLWDIDNGFRYSYKDGQDFLKLPYCLGLGSWTPNSSKRSKLCFKGPQTARQINRLVKGDNDTFYYLSTKGFAVLANDSIIYDSHPEFFLKNTLCLLPLENNQLYLGCNDGLYLYDLANNSYTQLFPKKLNSAINTLVRGQNDRILIGTNGSGIGLLTADSLTMKPLGTSPHSNVIFQIIPHDNNLWLRTQKEIFILDLHNPNENLTKARLPHKQLEKQALHALLFVDRTPYVVTKEGIFSIDSNTLNYPFSNSFKVSEVYVNEDRLGATDLRDAQLAYDENSIEVYLKLKTLHNNQNNRIKYKLKGLSEKWITTSTKNIKFLGLAPGSYTLVAAAESAIGQWSEPKKILSFTIQKPFIETWWFKIGVTLGVVALFFIAFKIGRIVTQREKELLHANISALKRQMNPHFILNALGSIRYYQNQRDLKNAENYIEKLIDLFRGIVYSTDRKRVLLSEELRQIKSYVALEKARFGSKLRFELNVPEELNPDKLFIPPMLLQPLVENALEHGLRDVASPVLEISIKLKNDILEVVIRDNGPSMEFKNLRSSSQSNSIGISNVKQRIDLIRQLEKKKLFIEFSTDGGLKVKLRIQQ